MKRTGYLKGALVLAVLGMGALGATDAWAQSGTGGKAHKVLTATTENNRVVRNDLGISYVMPAGYVRKTLDGVTAALPITLLEGPRFASKYKEADGRDHYVGTGILIYSPKLVKASQTLGFSADYAKHLLDAMNSAHLNGDNPLNYQNSARIQVAGHEALAILAETSFPETSDRALARVIILRHRGRQFVFIFQAVDVQFEALVPAFENFIGSLKFLQPDVDPATDAAPTGPINITISK